VIIVEGKSDVCHNCSQRQRVAEQPSIHPSEVEIGQFLANAENDVKTFDPWQQSHSYDAALLARCRDAVREVAPGATVILYGSRARSAAEPESDYDLLVLVEGPLSRQLEDRIGDRLYALELESGAVLSLIVYEKHAWDTPLCKAMPLHRNVDREGILL